MKNNAEASRVVKHLAVCIKGLRLQQGISHETLARKSGVTRQSISMLESGQRVPSIVTCLKVAKGLGISLQKLLDMAGR